MPTSYTVCLLPTSESAASFYKNGERDNTNAGFDLFVPEDVVFAPGERKLVNMRVKAVVSTAQGVATHYWMPPRSSLSKTGLILCNSVGVIDASYRGELMAYLWNSTDTVVSVKKGDRLVQIVAGDMGHIAHVRLVDELEATERGEGGFGSTGR